MVDRRKVFLELSQPNSFLFSKLKRGILLNQDFFVILWKENKLSDGERIMIVLITGASHTGKTLLAQKLLEKYKYPYSSIDHLKMGLIRSGNTELTPMSDTAELTEYLWPIVREMIKTAIENRQNLIVEGCYIPLDWEKDFSTEYLDEIKFFCLVMSENYIRTHFDDIKRYANVVEERLNDDDCTLESVLEDNAHTLALAQKNGINCILIEHEYKIDIDLQGKFFVKKVELEGIKLS